MPEVGAFGSDGPEGLPLASFGLASAQLLYQRHQVGVHLDMPCRARLRSRAAFIFATKLAFSNCAMAQQGYGIPKEHQGGARVSGSEPSRIAPRHSQI